MTEQSHKTLLLGGALVLGLMTSGCEPNGKDMDKTGAAEDCAPAPTAVIGVPSGTFIMGAHPAYAEEGPSRKVTMAAFDIDATEVTNAAFARFVEATGYV
ncbi:MAG: formylglycine-generating enzyme family protein, partial [Alphaproteobacteria bacterium]|nr:formylglycine-generating enzyme family protein [Alphaproteobacteria bacterium]